MTVQPLMLLRTIIFTHVTIITLSGHKPLGTKTNAKAEPQSGHNR